LFLFTKAYSTVYIRVGGKKSFVETTLSRFSSFFGKICHKANEKWPFFGKLRNYFIGFVANFPKTSFFHTEILENDQIFCLAVD
jgi:hypothetical protein